MSTTIRKYLLTLAFILCLPCPLLAVPVDGIYGVMGDISGSFTVTGGLVTDYNLISNLPFSSSYTGTSATDAETNTSTTFSDFCTVCDPSLVTALLTFTWPPNPANTTIDYSEVFLFGSGNAVDTGTVQITAVPVPSSMLLVATGLLGLAGYLWSQRRREATPVG